YDNLDTRFTSRESLTHLVVYRKMPAFLRNVTTEASLVVRLELEPMRLSDTGSFLRVSYRPYPEAPDDGWSLTALPFDSERVRVGYLYDLTFGGAEFVSYGRLLRAPAAKLDFDRSGVNVFVAAKAIPAELSRTVQPAEVPDGTPSEMPLET